MCDFCIWVSTGFAMVWCVDDSTSFACGNFWSSDAVPILRTPRDPSSCPLSRKGYEVTASGRRHPLCLGQLHRFYIDRGLGPEVQRLSPTGPFVKSLVRVSLCHAIGNSFRKNPRQEVLDFVLSSYALCRQAKTSTSSITKWLAIVYLHPIRGGANKCFFGFNMLDY